MIQPFADLHIHLGSTWEGQPVKISASKNLTIPTIMETAVHKKGIQMNGIIDCYVPAVIEQLQHMLDDGELVEDEEGGLIYDSGCLILGSEIEIYDENCNGPIHVLVYLPYLDSMKHFSDWLSQRMTNPNLSSQRYYGSAIELQEKTHKLGGLFVVAHAFTPFKSLYGKGVERSLSEVFDPDKIDAIELGLSADTEMADQLSELHSYSFLSNSDAHSLEKIGREYQQIQLEKLSFQELNWALKEREGRKVLSNFGLHPKLGKYYQTRCSKCDTAIEERSMKRCPHCEKGRVVNGVSNRVAELADTSLQLDRPTYVHHAPLDFIPGLGPNTLRKLREKFGTDMEIIHFTDREALESILPTRIVEKIIQSRKGSIVVEAGGAGKYGKLR